VMRLLNRYSLQSNIILATGYSLEKSISDDGRDYTTADVRPKTFDLYSNTPSCENQLHLLTKISAGKFDFAFVDGNHEKEYLRREIATIHSLLAPGGLLFIDDVDAFYGLDEVYAQSDKLGFDKLGENGRVGVLRKN